MSSKHISLSKNKHFFFFHKTHENAEKKSLFNRWIYGTATVRVNLSNRFVKALLRLLFSFIEFAAQNGFNVFYLPVLLPLSFAGIGCNVNNKKMGFFLILIDFLVLRLIYTSVYIVNSHKYLNKTLNFQMKITSFDVFSIKWTRYSATNNTLQMTAVNNGNVKRNVVR